MYINQITDLGQGRHKITLEEGSVFVLYKKELEKWDLAEESHLSEEDFIKIKNDILLKRAKKRGLYLLEKQGRSQSNLMAKLQEGFYPDDVIRQAMAYIESFGYLDDQNLARNIVESRRTQKSAMEIVSTLKLKGIQQETINQVMEEYYDESYEKEAIKYLMNKKRIHLESIAQQEKNKFFNYLVRKGFSYDSIKSLMQLD